MLDLTASIAAKSDQMNAIDLIGGPQTFTITNVTPGTTDQPWNYHLAEFPQPFKPSKTVLRILVALWGKNAENHIGRRFTLYSDSKVKWAGEEVGGIRISHMSHIDKPAKLMLPAAKNKKAPANIHPLPDTPTPAPGPTPDERARMILDALPDTTTAAEVNEWGARAQTANLLDHHIDGVTIREALTNRLTEVTT